MPHYAKDSGGTQRELPTPGLHQAVCVDVYDAGYDETPWGPKEKTMIIWELDEPHPEFGNPFRINRKYTTSLNEKSNLSKDLESWRGKGFTQQERRDGIDLEKLIGKGCLINVVHHENEASGIVYANVAAIMPLKREDWPKPSGAYTRKTDQDAAREHGQQHEDEARKRYGPQQPTPPVEAYANEQAAYVEDRNALPF